MTNTMTNPTTTEIVETLEKNLDHTPVCLFGPGGDYVWEWPAKERRDGD